MSLFGFLKKTTILPLSIVRDAITLGGVLEGKDLPSTAENLQAMADELDEIIKDKPTKRGD